MTNISFEEIIPLFDMLPSFDSAAAAAFPDKNGESGNPTNNLNWLSGWQGNPQPQLDRPSIAIFAGLHPEAGIDKVTAFAHINERVKMISSASAEVYDLCSTLDADMRLYEMGTTAETLVKLEAPNAARAIAYGMMAVGDGIDILGLGTVSLGIEGPAARLIESTLAEMQPPEPSHALSLLCRFGSEAIAGMFGAILAARLAKTPIVLDGSAALCAGLLMHSAASAGADHCRLASPITGFSQGPSIPEIFGTPLYNGDSSSEGDGAARAIEELRRISGWQG